jgi:hypothetical protein
MPLLFGCAIAFFVLTHIWAFVGPLVALINFLGGRFFIASVLMTMSLYSATVVWSDFTVSREEYKTLLILGLVLEGIKWCVKRWWQRRNEPEYLGNVYDRDPSGNIDVDMTRCQDGAFTEFMERMRDWNGDIVVNVVDDKIDKTNVVRMKDITPKVRRIR